MIGGSTAVTSFKAELLQAVHDFMTDEFKMALYGEGADLGADTKFYVPYGEAEGFGYLAGGQALYHPQIFQAARTAYVTFDDAVWSDSVLIASGAMIYNQTKQQRAVAVLNFGGVQVSNHGEFRVRMPQPTPSTALIRIS